MNCRAARVRVAAAIVPGPTSGVVAAWRSLRVGTGPERAGLRAEDHLQGAIYVSLSEQADPAASVVAHVSSALG